MISEEIWKNHLAMNDQRKSLYQQPLHPALLEDTKRNVKGKARHWTHCNWIQVEINNKKWKWIIHEIN